jgi:hypothetical protein
VWGISDPGRLLKKKWGSAYELALELYSMATGEQPGAAASTAPASPGGSRGVAAVERAHAEAPTQEQRRIIIQAIEQAGRTRAPAVDYTPPPGTPGRVASAVAQEAAGVLERMSESIEHAVIGTAVDQSVDWIGKKASELLGVPDQKPDQPPPQIPRLPLTAGSSPLPLSPTKPPRQAEPRPVQSQSAGPGIKHGTDSPATAGPSQVRPVSTSPIWDRDLDTGPVGGPLESTDFTSEPAPLNASYPPDAQVVIDEATDHPLYPTELTPNRMTPLAWANPKTKLVFLDTAVTAASGVYTGAGDSSDTFKPGSGHAKFLDFYSDGPNVYPQDEPSPVWSMCQFPMQYIFAIAHNIGEDWWVWPAGGTVVVTTRTGGISASTGAAPGSGTCDLTPFYNGSYQNAGSATVYSDMSATVGSTSGTRVVCGVDGNGYLHAVAEACS